MKKLKEYFNRKAFLGIPLFTALAFSIIGIVNLDIKIFLFMFIFVYTLIFIVITFGFWLDDNYLIPYLNWMGNKNE